MYIHRHLQQLAIARYTAPLPYIHPGSYGQFTHNLHVSRMNYPNANNRQTPEIKNNYRNGRLSHGESRLQIGRRRYESWTRSPTTTDEDEDLASSVPRHPKTQCPPTDAPRALAPRYPGAPLRWATENPITLARHEHVVSEESLHTEPPAAEHSEEEPDAGAQEGSGDDYEG
ncbi:hypothetical protein B0H13DRAFT_1864858 [Mycena leptocephala]|nr:hypothetical protein B0H13DRAFT_1864858 [Mycena leptocephala]